MRQLRRDYVSDNFNQKRYNFVSKCCVIKGLRRVLEGLVVTMHEGLCEQYVKFDFVFALTFVHCDNKPRHVVLNNDYNMTFSISFNITSWMSVFSTQNTNIGLEARAVSRATPIVTSRDAL